MSMRLILCFLILCGLSLGTHWQQIYYSGNFTYDEGVYLLTVKALRSGEILFKDIYYSQFPLYVRILDVFSSGPEISVPAIRWITWLHFPLLLASTGYLAFVFFGGWAAALSMLVITLDPAVHALSHVVLGNLPSLAWAVLSWATLEASRRSKYRTTLFVLSALSFAIAVQIKALVVPIIVVLFVSLWPYQNLKTLLKDMFLWGMICLAGSMMLFYLTDYEWHYIAQLQGGAATGSVHMQPLSERFWQLLRYVTAPSFGVVGSLRDTTNWPLLILGFASALLGFRHFKGRPWSLILIWLLLLTLILLIHNPVWEHHLVLLAPGIALVTGAVLGEMIGRRPQSRLFKAGIITGFAVLGITARASLGPAFFFKQAQEKWNLRAQPVVDMLQQITHPGDIVLSDEPFFVVAAQRSMPAWWIDVSRVRIASGSFTCADFRKGLDRVDTKAVVVEKRFSLIPCPEDPVLEIQKRFPQTQTFDSVRVFYR